MSVFDTDFNLLVKQLLPVRLRQSKTIAWLKCLIMPVKWLWVQFRNFRLSNLYKLWHNSQVCYMEAALNDTFDPNDRRIFIGDPDFVDPLYLFLDIEEKPVYIDLDSEIGTAVIDDPDPVPLFMDSEVSTGGGDSFIVNVPSALVLTAGQVLRLRALVDYYRLPGRVYSVVFF